MNTVESFATYHPIIFVLVLTVVWFVLLMVFSGIASSLMRKPYGHPATIALGQLGAAGCILLLVWRLGWLEESGIVGLGTWQAWLLGLVGVIYFASASLYSFFGRVAFDLPGLMRLSESRSVVLTNLTAALSEEVLFRGAVLYALARVWADTRQGMIGCAVLASLLFAVMHMTQILTHRLSCASALLLALETFVVSLWWGSVVLFGGSIWPAVMLHFVVNALVALQALTTPMIEPEIWRYRRMLWFSIPLGVIGIGLLILAAPQAVVPEAL